MINGVFKNNQYGFFTSNREDFINHLQNKHFIYQKQIHSNIVNFIHKYNKNDLPIIGDGLLTNCKNLQLLVSFADCLPLIINGNNICGVLHLGWKSLYLGLLEKTIDILKSYKEYDCQFIIGPTILVDNFQVSQEFFDLFKSHENFDIFYKNAFKTEIVYKFSLTKAVKNILNYFQYKNIIDTKIDTYTSNTWCSYRREKNSFDLNFCYVFKE
ncbi:hypothetical protein AB836_01760 [Rickettsiales bacterium (ex Bugula neritina AB1)]|nr:hypothetical protein AB836_01760 [Rickettsiales bacterium (ex Bugula neritina AB1)]